MSGKSFNGVSLLILVLVRMGHAQEKVCKQDDSLRGKVHPDLGIVQHTFEYAAPGERWSSAKLIELPPTGGDATGQSNQCPQVACLACGWRNPANLNPASPIYGAERCLYLSTFAPTQPSSSLPVVFHVHHGELLHGFKSELEDVKSIVQKQILVSNANFRLGALGFFAHPDVQTNVGQKDLLLALNWVRNNICNLGGNPYHVTVTGSSSGATQVMLMLASRSSGGLFRGAWVFSPTAFGTSDFFSKDIPHIFESHSKTVMRQAGCGSIGCMKQLPYKKLLSRLLDAENPLVVLSPQFLSKAKPVFAFDNVVVPNVLEAACTQSLANSPVSVVAGHAMDELDTIKFQFPMRQMLENVVDARVQQPRKSACLQTKLLARQGLQETMEDYLFGLSSYHVGTKHGDNPRWHFLVSAPGSISHRAWHTTAELLSWGSDMNEDTPQYHHLAKKNVLINVQEELRLYAQNNFIHFVRHNRPQDATWMQTRPSPAGEIGGLPSKLWDQTPLQGRFTWEQHHSNKSIGNMYELACHPDGYLKNNLDAQDCRMDPHPSSNSLIDDLRTTLAHFKKSDFDFSVHWLLEDLPQILKSQ